MPIYLGSVPTRSRHDVGLVQAFGEGNRSKTNDVLRSLRCEAQRTSCDAISNVDVSTNGQRAEAVCIYWL